MSYGFGCAMVMFVSPNNFMCGFGTRDYFSKGIYPDKNQKKKNKKFMCCILPLKGILPVNPIFDPHDHVDAPFSLYLLNYCF